jgi:hypothetical protein
MSRVFLSTLLFVVLPGGLRPRLARAADVAVTAEKRDDRVVFKVGGATPAEYQFGGTVQVEKGTGTKPLAKPFVYPLVTPKGAAVTRGWPLVRENPATTDHFHQKSVWFCHGDVIPEGIEFKPSNKGVKGIDFWAENAGHGRIVCTFVGPATSRVGVAVSTHNEWQTQDGVKILDEDRLVSFMALPAGYLITFDIDLFAGVCPITFGDTKEGSMGVRVNDEFRLAGPKSDGIVTSSEGTVAKAPAKDNLPMWGKPADWHDYSGTAGGKVAGIAVFDNPKNSYRSAWHTRAYGLMAANPFGRAGSGFPSQKGKTELVKLAKGDHLKLRYGVYVHDGDAAAGKVAEAFAGFAGK